HRKANAGGEARHSCADDERIVHGCGRRNRPAAADEGVRSGASKIAHARFKIADGAAHGRHLDVVVLWNINAIALAQLHDNVEEIHAVQRDLLAQWLIIVDFAEILVRYDVGKDINDLSTYVFSGH